MKSFATIFFAALFCILVFNVFRVESCSCLQSTTKEKVNRSNRVFFGRVEAVFLSESDMNHIYLVRVSEECKGVAGDFEAVVTASNSAMCGVSLTVGYEGPFLVDENNFTGLCNFVDNVSDVKRYCGKDSIVRNPISLQSRLNAVRA